LYQKLDDWIFYSVKCENDAVDKITQLFGKAIEKQEKVQKELRLEYVDVFISHKYLNFLTPPVKI
jgi:lipocalin